MSTIEQMNRDLSDTQFEKERIRQLSREARNEIEYSLYVDELAVLIDREHDMIKAIADRMARRRKK